jgi:hypothetical protein
VANGNSYIVGRFSAPMSLGAATNKDLRCADLRMAAPASNSIHRSYCEPVFASPICRGNVTRCGKL